MQYLPLQGSKQLIWSIYTCAPYQSSQLWRSIHIVCLSISWPAMKQILIILSFIQDCERRISNKLRQLRVWNRIFDDSDSKLSELGQWLYNDTDFNVQIRFQLNDDVNFWLKFTNFQLQLIKFNHFSIKIWLKYWKKCR